MTERDQIVTELKILLGKLIPEQLISFTSHVDRRIYNLILLPKNHSSFKGLLHYTSLENAKKILLSKELWLNPTKSMNDPRELEFLSNEFLEHQFGFSLTKNKITNNKGGVFVAAFSKPTNEDTEDLLLWRLYGGNGKGVCLQFDYEWTNKKESASFELIEVTYIKDIQLRQTMEELKEYESNRNIRFFIKDQSIEFNTSLAGFKSNYFRQENEIRLVYNSLNELPNEQAPTISENDRGNHVAIKFDAPIYKLVPKKIIIGCSFSNEEFERAEKEFKEIIKEGRYLNHIDIERSKFVGYYQ